MTDLPPDHPATFQQLLNVDAALVRAGHHGLTPFWHDTLQRFYEHPTARTLLVRAGRGAAKSFNSCKVAVTETVFGDYFVPLGERHYWCFISISKDEAQQRLTLLQAFLKALGVGFDVQGDTINLRDLPRGFRVVACQIGAVSGFRTFGYSADELAKWSGSDYANPAQEVCASADSMSINHERGRRLLISSPWGLDDFHAQQFDRGEEAGDQVVAFAPSWIANPSLTEEQCRINSRGDDRIFSREYLAQPGQIESSALDFNLVNAAFASYVTSAVPQRARKSILLDPSGLRGDRFTMCAVAEYAGRLSIVDIDHLESGKSTFIEVIPKIVAFARKHYAHAIYSDQYYSETLAAQLTGYQFTSHSWNAQTKNDALITLRRLLLEAALTIAPHASMQAELVGLRARLQPNNKERVDTNGRDFAALCFLLAHFVNEHAIVSSAAPGGVSIATVTPAALDRLERASTAFGFGDDLGYSTNSSRDDMLAGLYPNGIPSGVR
jgi:hypothetical protein